MDCNIRMMYITLFRKGHFNNWTSIKWYYVYWTVHHLDSWIKIDQLDVTRFIISLFTAQHVSNVSTSIFRNLRLIVDLFHVLYCAGSMCVGITVWFGWGGMVSLCWLKRYRKFLKTDVLTFETCWAVNSEIIKQVTSSWSIFIQLNDIIWVLNLSKNLIEVLAFSLQEWNILGGGGGNKNAFVFHNSTKRN